MSEKHVNHLANEKSPYLLQHAHNPIDWYPWGEEAFAKAKEEDKPIFFSCGYSTCHWCHVMERESFEDKEVAEVLNQHFVAIKVDREERPDIDHIYMEVCQALTGQGGWPLTVILTPDKKPIFAGTYFSKQSRWGRPGLMDILAAIHKQWESDAEGLVRHSEEITKLLGSSQFVQGELSAQLLDDAYRQLEKDFDEQYGGFGRAPKFPAPHNLMFLLRHWRRTGKRDALAMAEKTLDAMREGGIHDHLGYGFARYSTDRRWLVPHFEKMLYDNALLCMAYTEAYQCTGEKRFAQVAENILAYVLRDMTDEGGAFFSAEDADSEGEEGRFYVFTRSEVLDVLGQEEGRIFADFYDVSEKGNFEHGTSIINHIGRDIEAFALQEEMTPDALSDLLARCRTRLYTYREKRVHPYKDDKILTAWNCLMIAALAKASHAFGNPFYAETADRALQFIFSKLRRDDGRLLTRYRDGEGAYPAYLDDYAFLLWALIELYEAQYDPGYLQQAVAICAEMRRLFWDEEKGGFFFYGSDGETLITRPKEFYDGAIPSGNSVAAWALLRLSGFTGVEDMAVMAERLLQSFAGEAAKYPKGYTFYLIALDLYLAPKRKIVITGQADSREARAMLSATGRAFMPWTSIAFNNLNKKETMASVMPEVAAQTTNGETAAFICENFACLPPIRDIREFEDHLKIYEG